ncbi:MAG: rRNA pseudouridine synthase [Rhodobacterales bacterium]|nr:rRNA pseudouridine synthase [Rhodobacterales bacterium]
MTGKEKPKAPAKAAPKTSDSPEGDRIAKVLSRAGIASRREAERLIELGEVKVNGKVITSPALNVTAKDKITVRGEPVAEPEPPRLWLYYKPEGLVTSASDEKGRDTVFDHLPEDMPRVMSVGRLDLNSEGLLLLTNDGELKRRLELPSTGWLRKYRVRVKGNPTEPEIEPLRKGITIDGERFQPMEVKLDRHQGANAWLTVGLREGKNREIRRAMNHIGLTVNRLIRTSYGPFRLNELKPGEVEEVKARVLRDQLGLAEGDAKPAPKPGKAVAKPARRAAGAPDADGSGKPARKTLKPGEGLKTLSETWKKATRNPARGAEDRSPTDRPKPARGTGPRPGPRPKSPRQG